MKAFINLSKILKTYKFEVHELFKTSYRYCSFNIMLNENDTTLNNSQFIKKRYDNIVKPKKDDRVYRGLKLNNDLKVLLISDPDTDKSAAALDVNIGFMSDPENLPGLAHFCEHMLFMGTEKYPSENDYLKFLNEHGGSSNASTYADHTKFYFDIAPEYFTAALDRFSQFFVCPLFTESATEREINAVNSEHDKNVSNDTWRVNQLDKHLSNKNHPYSRFGTGNSSTLSDRPAELGINVREELLKFHKKWYSANIMALAVLSKESLDELENLVVELFKNVANKNVKEPIWLEHPYTEDHLQIQMKILPIKDVRNLNITFPIPDLNEHYKSGPGNYLSHLIGHEGPGSLLSLLRKKSWSNSLCSGFRSSARGFGFFCVDVDLTEEGLDNVNDIVELVFQYLNMLKKEGPQKWIFDENCDILKMKFNFRDKIYPINSVSHHVHNLLEYPIDEVISAGCLLYDWKPELINFVGNFFVPDKIRITLIAKHFENEVNEIEPWYGTKYSVEKVSNDLINRWKNCGTNENFKLPQKNDFIPNNFDLVEQIGQTITKFPEIIKDSSIIRVWFKQDDEFLLPKLNMNFEFVSPLAYLDPLNYNLTCLFTELFKDSLNEYSYDASLAGLGWNLMNVMHGMTLSITGYNDKQHVFLEKIIDRLLNFKIDPKRFEILKEMRIRSLKNFAAEQPYHHAVYYLALLLAEHAWTKQELLQVMDLVTVKNLEIFIPQFFSRVHIECLIHGNILKDDALEIANLIESELNSKYKVLPLLSQQLTLNREIKLEDGCHFLYEVENSIHRSSCTELYYQCGLQETKLNVLLELFLQIIGEPFFNNLRTKEQLGYIVFSGLRRSNGVQGIRMIIQSEKHPTFLDSRIEQFLIEMKDYISDLTNEEFEQLKESLAIQRLEKPKRLTAQSIRFWSEISTQQYHFDRASIEVDYLRSVTKNDIIYFYETFIKFDSPKRNKMAVYVISTAEGGAGRELKDAVNLESVLTTDNYEKINDVVTFKTTQGLFPQIQPYINIPRKGTSKSKL